jgi:RNase H-fold protein (predicted Holliday junction resolvase)
LSVAQHQRYVAGFDPGRDKCGVAVMTGDRRLCWHGIVASPQVISRLKALRCRFPFSQLVMGNQTASSQWRSQLREQFPDLEIIPVAEQFTSQLARQRYWQMYPPRGWQRLIPEGMRLPPRPIDDIVAIILLERWLS